MQDINTLRVPFLALQSTDRPEYWRTRPGLGEEGVSKTLLKTCATCLV